VGVGFHIFAGFGLTVKAVFRAVERDQINGRILGQNIHQAFSSAVNAGLVRYQTHFFPFHQMAILAQQDFIAQLHFWLEASACAGGNE